MIGKNVLDSSVIATLFFFRRHDNKDDQEAWL